MLNTINPLDMSTETECVYNVEEPVGLDQFLQDFFLSDEKILVNANWLQDKLKEMYKLELTQKRHQREKQELERNLNILKSRIDTLNTTVDIMRMKKTPSIHIQRYLDVSV